MAQILTVDDLKQAFIVEPFKNIYRKRDISLIFKKFAQEQPVVFKQFLLDIIERKVSVSEDDGSREAAFWVLATYFKEQSLLDLCLHLLEDEILGHDALNEIISIGHLHQELFQGYPSLAEPLMKVWQENPTLTDKVIEALGVARCVEVIDFIVPYLNDPSPYILLSSINALARLSKIAGREDIWEKLLSFLEPSYHREIRLTTAMCLHHQYPERFTDQKMLEFAEKLALIKKDTLQGNTS
jgi:hypothetical protein